MRINPLNKGEKIMLYLHTILTHILTLSIVLLTSLTFVGLAKGEEHEEIGRQIQDILDRAVVKTDSQIPGALLHVRTANGNWEKSAGLADISTQTLLRPNDKFRAGSILKMFVAVTTLQLVEEGYFDLDATLSSVLPGVAQFQNGDLITVRMLLNHTSGIPDALTDAVKQEIVADPVKIWTIDEWFDLAVEQAPVFAPGEDWSYSNTNYLLLGQIIEEATGRSWRSEVRQRVIAAAGLWHTFLPEPGDLEIPGSHARGYVNGVDYTGVDPSMMDAAGASALITTAPDLARFICALFNGRFFQHSATLCAMLPNVAAEDESGLLMAYGLGLEQYVYAGIKMIGHSGDTAGYASCVYVLPSEGITIAAMVNSYDMYSLFLDVVIPAIDVLKMSTGRTGRSKSKYREVSPCGSLRRLCKLCARTPKIRYQCSPS